MFRLWVDTLLKKKINNEKELLENFNIEILLSEIYYYKLTCRDIQKIYNIDERFMSKYNKTHNLGIKKSWKKQKENYINQGIYSDDLYQYYIIEEKSLREIGALYNVTHGTIKNALLFFNICLADEIKPFNYTKYYDNRREYKDCNENTRIYRKIMEKEIGRKLDDNEVVHHLDFNRKNNDITNLFLFSTERHHALFHGYIESHEYIHPNIFLKDIFPNYKKTFLNYEWLYNMYINEDMSINFISQICKVSRVCITNSLKYFDLFDKKKKRVNQYDRFPKNK